MPPPLDTDDLDVVVVGIEGDAETWLAKVAYYERSTYTFYWETRYVHHALFLVQPMQLTR